MNSFGGTKRQQNPKNVSRSTAIAAAAKDPDVQKLHSKQKEVVFIRFYTRAVCTFFPLFVFCVLAATCCMCFMCSWT